MSQTQKEQVICRLSYLRQKLRDMDLGIKDDDLIPDPGELRGIMAQMEALLELIEGNTKVQSNSDATPQRRDSTRKSGTYDVYIEIDCDCAELLDAIGLDYDRSELDDTQNEVCMVLTKDEFFDVFERVQLPKPEAQYFAEALLNAEIAEYTTRITVDKPTGETITFE